MMRIMGRFFLVLPITALLAGQPAPAVIPLPVSAAQPSAIASPAVIKDEHVRPVPHGQHTTRTAAQIAFQMPVVHVGRTATGPAIDLSNAFLTRPYMNYHYATSIFDHCNPDYSLDGRVCASDGTVALKSNGVDPGFSLGYAATPGGRDYVYYDGHNGWDLALNYENVMAAADGTVQLAGIDSINPCFGQTIIVNHPNGFSTRYAHLSQIYVSPGQSVTRGKVIALSGNTGCSTGAHLHFGVYVTSTWTAIDPFGWTGVPGADPWPSDQGNLWLTGNPANPLPSAPGNLTATAGNAAASLIWSAPPFDGGSAISSYTVTSSPGGLTATVPGTQLTATMTGLTDGTTYTFTVVAVNGVGASSASAPSNPIMPLYAPGPPLNVSATPGNESMSVSWSPPTLEGASPITSYTVKSTTGNLSTTVNTGTTATFPGISSLAPTSFTVSATNAIGTGLPSVASNAVIAYPVAQMLTLEAYGGVHGDAATATPPVTAYWPNWKIARSSALLPDGSGGYVVDGYGGVHPFGQAAAVSTTIGWPNWDIAKDIVLLPTSTASKAQGYVLEGYGGLHGFGGAPATRLSTYWGGWDIARRVVLLSDGTGGYVMDAYGGLHGFAVGANPMPPNITNFAYWSGWQIVRDVVLLPGSTATNVAGLTLDGFGGVHGFGTAGGVTDMAYWPNWDIARAVAFMPASTAAHPQGWTVDGYGGIHAFGGAPPIPGPYWLYNDVAVKLMVR